MKGSLTASYLAYPSNLAWPMPVSPAMALNSPNLSNIKNTDHFCFDQEFSQMCCLVLPAAQKALSKSFFELVLMKKKDCLDLFKLSSPEI
jgi:hypothetical protein